MKSHWDKQQHNQCEITKYMPWPIQNQKRCNDHDNAKCCSRNIIPDNRIKNCRIHKHIRHCPIPKRQNQPLAFLFKIFGNQIKNHKTKPKHGIRNPVRCHQIIYQTSKKKSGKHKHQTDGCHLQGTSVFFQDLILQFFVFLLSNSAIFQVHHHFLS